MARMNLKAGIKASENAAFDAAKVYFKEGREALGSRGWEGDYRAMLDLCSHRANACFVTGDFDSMTELIDEVLSKDIDTKRRTWLASSTEEASITIIREFVKVKRLLKNKTAEDIADLPELGDQRYEMWQRMNEHLASSIFHPGFAGLGLLLCGPFGKPREGCEMAKAADLILERPGMQSGASYTVFITQCFCYHWASPLQVTVVPWGLDSIQKELEATIRVLTQLKQDDVKLQVIILLTTVKKLRGIDADGSAGDEIMDSCWQLHHQLATSLYLHTLRYTFLEALTYLKAAQSASGWKRRQMKKCARKTLQLIQGWAKNGIVNVVHYLYILEAELGMLHGNGKNKNAKKSFNDAIATSSRNGFIQDRALVHELASAYFEAQGDDYWGNHHIECSKACYQEWGCGEKVEQLISRDVK
eukprot:scaffold5549_cov79-Skeletonema_dohrnii-CCMP3373.AAC.11